EVLSNVIVECLSFVQIVAEGLGKVIGFGFDFRARLATFFFKSGVPAAQFLPAGKGGHLHIRFFAVFVFLLLLLFNVVLLVAFFVGLALQVAAGPGIGAPSVGFRNFWIAPRFALQL